MVNAEIRTTTTIDEVSTVIVIEEASSTSLQQNVKTSLEDVTCNTSKLSNSWLKYIDRDFRVESYNCNFKLRQGGGI
jgi:hypothetical protein